MHLTRRPNEKTPLPDPPFTQYVCRIHFVACMTSTEARAPKDFAEVIKNFLGNKREHNYKDLLQEMLSGFEAIGCYMSINLHYLKVIQEKRS